MVCASIGCANIWGFADLREPDDAGAPDHDASDARSEATPTIDSDSSSSGEASSDAGVMMAEAACSLANSASCRGKCGSATASCGCLRDLSTDMQYCGMVGAGMQREGCADDLACAPGFGCDPDTGQCEHWCRPTSTTCPVGTDCYLEAGVFFQGTAFGRCL
jgi:hypothetical protein